MKLLSSEFLPPNMLLLLCTSTVFGESASVIVGLNVLEFVFKCKYDENCREWPDNALLTMNIVSFRLYCLVSLHSMLFGVLMLLMCGCLGIWLLWAWKKGVAIFSAYILTGCDDSVEALSYYDWI